MPSPLSMFRSLSMGARRADAPSEGTPVHGASQTARRFLDRLATRAKSECHRASVRLRPRITQSKPVQFQELQLLMHDWELFSPEKRWTKAQALLKAIDRYVAFMQAHPEWRLSAERIRIAQDWRAAITQPPGQAPSSSSVQATRTPPMTRRPASRSAPPSDLPEYTSTAREQHVRALMAATPDLHPPVDRGDYAVVGFPEQRVLYRLWPMSDKISAAASSAKARAMAISSAMLESITAQTGLSLGLPRATYALPVSSKAVPVVVADEVSGRAPDQAASADELMAASTSARARQRANTEARTLQQLLIGHWLMGKPNPTWADLRRDEQGQLRARALSPHMGPLSEVWREAVNHGPSELFMTPDRTSLSAMACRPLDSLLCEMLRQIDLTKVEASMTRMTRLLDDATTGNVTPQRVIGHRLAPLRALQEVLWNPASRDLPLEMLMVDVGDRLRVIDRKASAAEAGR